MLFVAVLLVVTTSADRRKLSQCKQTSANPAEVSVDVKHHATLEIAKELMTSDDDNHSAYSPPEPSPEDTCRNMDDQSAYFAALGFGDNVINVFMKVDVPDQGLEETGFRTWLAKARDSFNGFDQFPSFRSIIMRSRSCCCKACGCTPYQWCSAKFLIDNHLREPATFEINQIGNPDAHVLSELYEVASGGYFRSYASQPRWQVRFYRYVTPQGVTKHLYIYLRLSHTSADGVSLISILHNAVYSPLISSASGWLRSPNPAARLDPDAWILDPNVPPVQNVGKKEGIRVGVDTYKNIARIDINKERIDETRRVLGAKLNIRVTITTLLLTAMLRVVQLEDDKNQFMFAMPKDGRGAALNRAKTHKQFIEAVNQYAESLKAGDQEGLLEEQLKQARPNQANGGAYKVARCPKESTEEGWAECFRMMEAALGNEYQGNLKQVLSDWVTAGCRASVQELFTKYWMGPMDFMLSSMNAGPFGSTLLRAPSMTSSLQTVFMNPSEVYFKRTVMALRTDEIFSIGIMGPNAHLLVTMLGEQIQGLINLASPP